MTIQGQYSKKLARTLLSNPHLCKLLQSKDFCLAYPCVSQQQASSPAQSKFDKDKEERGERAGREEVGQEGKKSGRPQFGKDNGRVASGVAERVGCGAIGLGSYFVLTRPRRVALSDNSLL